MSANSKIEWTDHTFNPWWGCHKKPGRPGCDHCYAEPFAKRVGHKVWGPAAPRRFFGDKHWAEPLKWNRKAEKAGKRARVFSGSMCDVFEDRDILIPFRSRLFELVEATPFLDWMLLTKRAENMALMSQVLWREGWPANAWALCTVENQAAADEQIPHLLRVPAPVRLLSVEPMLGPVDIYDALSGYPQLVSQRQYVSADMATDAGDPSLDGARLSDEEWEQTSPALDGVICGGESGHGARPMHPDWPGDLRDQCAAAGVPFFFQRWGEWCPRSDGYAQDENKPMVRLEIDGSDGQTVVTDVLKSNQVWMGRVGKKATGRLLDGCEHNDLPGAASRGQQ